MSALKLASISFPNADVCRFNVSVHVVFLVKQLKWPQKLAHHVHHNKGPRLDGQRLKFRAVGENRKAVALVSHHDLSGGLCVTKAQDSRDSLQLGLGLNDSVDRFLEVPQPIRTLTKLNRWFNAAAGQPILLLPQVLQNDEVKLEFFDQGLAVLLDIHLLDNHFLS
jgi:hypothetical protein